MMGYTHAIGGATALAGYAFVTGDVAHAPLWAFGWATLSALVPDADNAAGSILNRIYLMPMKVLTVPLWAGRPGLPLPWEEAHHRGRTHSLLGLLAYVAIIFGWLTLLTMAATNMNLSLQLNVTTIMIASAVGYASHLTLDLINLPGEQLLWPMQYAISFPPFRSHGHFPGRFAASSVIGGLIVTGALFGFLSWWAVQNARDIFAATAADHTVSQLLGFALAATAALLHWILSLTKGK
jgi:membrane-bound metal-dependent hydrolase YbcI (DUF457 family)